METAFRGSMSSLHTWAGVIVGALLFAIFWMGTLTVFDREIDRWMMPATRLEASSEPISLDRDVVPAFFRIPNVRMPSDWHIILPSERVPVLQIRYDDPAGHRSKFHLSRDGKILEARAVAKGLELQCYGNEEIIVEAKQVEILAPNSCGL